MVDYIKQTDIGHLSDIGLFQVDCKLLRTKRLKWLFYREPMGQGDPLVDNTPDENWEYWQPNSSGETAFMSICDYVN